jgi:hypothetical protein
VQNKIIRKGGNLMLIAAVVVFVIAELFGVFHLRSVARPLIIAGFVLFAIGFFFRTFTSVNSTRWQNFSPQFYRWHLYTYKVIDFGSLILCIGALGKISHIDELYVLVQIGMVLYVIGILSLFILFKSKNKYIIDSELDKQLSNDDLEKYAGIYDNEDLKMKISVKVINGYLVGQATGQGPYQLSAVKEHVFNNLSYKLVMEFHLEQGEFILIQNGGYFPFIKE